MVMLYFISGWPKYERWYYSFEPSIYEILSKGDCIRCKENTGIKI